MSMTDQEKERRSKLFKSIRAELGLSQGGLAKWLHGTDTVITRKYISRKERQEVAVGDNDLCFLRTLQVLKAQGIDLKSVEFSEDLEIVKLDKK